MTSEVSIQCGGGGVGGDAAGVVRSTLIGRDYQAVLPLQITNKVRI